MNSSVRPGAAPAQSTYPIAALERRFTAFAIDRLLTWTLAAGAGVAAWFLADAGPWGTLGVVLGVAAVLGVLLGVVAGLSGTSPGKAMTGLRVVHHGTGTPIGVGRALWRALLLGLSGLPTFGLGLATLAWTAVEDRGKQRRGWHDQQAHSVVVDVRPIPASATADDEAAPRHIVNLTAMRLVPAPVIEQPVTPARTPNPAWSPSAAVPPPPPGATQARGVRPAPTSPPPGPPPPPVAPVAPVAPARPPVAPTPPPARPSQPSVSSLPPAPAPAPVSAPPPPPPPPPPSRRTPPAAAAPLAVKWRIEFDDGRTIDVTGVVLVGRRPEPRNGEAVAHLVPLSSKDMSVSKTHAQIGPSSDGSLLVMDRGSTNGSLLVRGGVTRHLAAGRPSTLQPGDRVHFGDRSMTVIGRS